ncbi:MAG: argininosuccinate synthase, partial [Oscillospiraceae bacterium]|nr:argininosuccinate synthase [Oscillospiraceae bacterium]
NEKLSAKEIILKLNEIGGANGIGLLDIVENRLVGMKCRGVYETPGGEILYFAHNYLETVCLDKATAHKKQELAVTFADLVYNGQWYTPLREALSAFVDKTQEHVTGKVKLKLYKGNIIKAGVWSDWSLYSEDIATFGEDDVYNQADSAGFISLYGLPIKVQAQVNRKNAIKGIK